MGRRGPAVTAVSILLAQYLHLYLKPTTQQFMSGKKSKRLRKAAVAVTNMKISQGKEADANKEYERLKAINKTAPHNAKPIR